MASGSSTPSYEGIRDPSRKSSSSSFFQSSPNPSSPSSTFVEPASSTRSRSSSLMASPVDRRVNRALDQTAASPYSQSSPFLGSDKQDGHSPWLMASVASAPSIVRTLSALSFEGATATAFTESVIRSVRASQETLPPTSPTHLDPRSPSLADRSFTQDRTPTKSARSPSVRSNRTLSDEVLYKCECVAEFDLQGLELSFMGYPFLKM